MLAATLKFEQVLRDRPALILLTQQIGDGHADVFKKHLALLDLTVEAGEGCDGNAGCRHVDE